MTTSAQTSPLPPTARDAAEPHDRAPGARLQCAAVVAGGALFALGNLAHPLSHSDAAMTSPLWATAHLTFAAGGVLAAAGFAPVHRLFRRSVTGRVGLALLWLGLVLLPVSSALEVWVAPAVGHEEAERIGSAPLLVLVSAVPVLLGPVLVAVAALRHRLLPVAAPVLLLLFPVGGILSAGLPHSLEGLGVIPASVALGAALVITGRAARGA